jgi:hypothetical protein
MKFHHTKFPASSEIVMSYLKFTEHVSSTLLTNEEFISASTKLELAQQTRTKVAREAVKHEPNLRLLVALCNTLDAYADNLRDFHNPRTSEEPWIIEGEAEAKPYSIYSEVQVEVTECESDSGSESDDSDDSDEDDWSESLAEEIQDNEEEFWSDNSAETMIGDDEEELSKGMKDMWLRPTSLQTAPAWTSDKQLGMGTRRAFGAEG